MIVKLPAFGFRFGDFGLPLHLNRVPSRFQGRYMKRRTKIVCTLGPAVDSRQKIKELIEAGMNVARINCSHGDWQTRRQWIEWIRDLSSEIAPIAILADLQGPKFRIGILPEDGLHLELGGSIIVGPAPGATIPVNQKEI